MINLKKENADFQFISSSENNAWLLNIRGKDTKYSPIPYCYVLIDKKKNIKLFCDLKKIPNYFKKYFKNIQFLDLDSTSEIISKIKKKKIYNR